MVMDVESYAALAAFELIEKQLPEGGQNQIIALIDVGANSMNLTVLKNDQQLYAREQAFGGNQLTQDIARQYGMNFEEAEAAKRANNLPDTYESELLRPFRTIWRLRYPEPCSSSSLQRSSTRFIISSWPGCATLPGADEAESFADTDQYRRRQPVCRHGVVGSGEGPQPAC